MPHTGDEQSGETGDAPLAWVMLDHGYHASCGLLNNGELVCWGEVEFKEHPDSPFKQVSVSIFGGCGIDVDGSVTCWCTNPSELRPCQNVPAGNDFVAVEDADYWACAEDTDHRLHCWGPPQLVRGTPTEPVLAWSIELNVGCAVLESGAVSCWGDTYVWSLTHQPVALGPPEGLKYTDVSVGRTHACALDTDGEAHCWGMTGFQEPYPVAPPGPFVSLASWHAVTCGLRADGSATCWYDLPGLLDNWFIPDERWAQLGIGEWDGCGLTLDGRGLCFGVSYAAGAWEVPDLEDL